MGLKKFIESKISFIGILLLLLLAVSSFLLPVLIRNEKNNWKKSLREINQNIKNDFAEVISSQYQKLTETIRKVTNENIPEDEKKNLFSYDADDVILIFNNKFELIEWSERNYKVDIKTVVKKYHEGEYYFDDTAAFLFISMYVKTEKGFVFCAIPLMQKFSLNYKYSNKADVFRYLSNKYATEFNITTEEPTSNDGRISTFQLFNNHNRRIADIYYESPTLDSKLSAVAQRFYFYQSLIVVIILFIWGLKLRKYFYSLKVKMFGVFLFCLYLIFFRVLLFAIKYPGYFIQGKLSDPSVFSSNIAFGVFKSPIELFISLIFLILVVVSIGKEIDSFELVTRSFRKKSKRISVLFYVSISLGIISYLLLWRAFGAAIKSIIFDSSIRYFQDADFIPSFTTLFMEFNLLIIGLLSLACSVLLINFILTSTREKFNLSGKKFLVLYFVLLQAIGFLFDYLQKQPQGTHLIRFFFIAYPFYFLYKNDLKKKVQFIHLVIFVIISSFLSISILIYHNSKLELKSLKTISNELMRSNENMVSFAIVKFLGDASESNELMTKLRTKNVDYNELAFAIWSNSDFEQLSLSSNVNIIDADKNLLGSFSFEYNENYVWDWTAKDEVLKHQKIISSVINKNSKVLRGIAPIYYSKKIIGYVELSAIIDLNSLGFENTPPIFSSSNFLMNSPINLSQLKIFDFQNDTLKNYYTDIIIPYQAVNKINDKKKGDKFIEIRLYGKKNVFYLKKQNINGIKRVLAVGLEEKNTPLFLFDFFKVFFVHSLFFVLLLLIAYLFFYRQEAKFTYSFRFQLSIAFIVISLLPLIVLAFYFRQITNEKNLNSIYYKLAKRADSIENYIIEKNINKTSFQEAASNFDVNFSVYKNRSLIFSTKNEYYNAGLIPKLLNPTVYKNLIRNDQKEFVIKELIGNYSYNSLYHKVQMNGEVYILKVSDLFNAIQLPMTGSEIDVFLFGVYSFSMIMLLALSAFFANQISLPIRKLTEATKAVGSGDMNVEINLQSRGEIKDLINGFNKMVRQIKSSQNELAAMEREAAWKEMAKQVAHEIKNPLTPMKLSVQQLIASKKDNSPHFDEFFYKILETIIRQIDNLRNIASEFSSFAKMPSIKIQNVEIIELINQTIMIFNEENINIRFEKNIDKLILETDSDQLQRSLINMIRNSIQAKAKNILVKLISAENQVEILVCDNGSGIPNQLHDKIFEIDFTTKKTGMGIGLYLVKRFVESMNGKILIEKNQEFTTIIKIILPKKL
ncbi:MAG: hypothetical protein Fur0015_06120 [Ignavibacteriales bacterium]